MKKLLVTILTIIMASTMALGLVACGGEGGDDGHVHTAGKQWQYDATHHWKNATCCPGEVVDKGTHTWVDGIVDGNGNMIYQCSKCPATK